MTNFAVYPYFDDYQTSAKENNYHKIMFIPGNAVQARELTQIQSMLQEQIKRNADHFFKNGSMIVPGHIFYDKDVVFLKMSDTFNSVNIETVGKNLIGLTIQGSSGVSAYVNHYEPATASDPATLFVKYVSSNGLINTFSAGEVLYNTEFATSVQIIESTNSLGGGSLVSIGEGIYYINGYFVGVDAQTIVLDKFNNTPTNLIGLEFNEKIVSASEDPNLYDNALGFPNYAAIGASRYQINLNLTKKSLDFTEVAGTSLITFIPLLKVIDGEIQFLIKDTQYSDIEKMLARRTYDESGDYIVNDFNISTANYRSNNRGKWVTSTPYIIGDTVINNNTAYVAKNNGYSGGTAPTHQYGEISDGGVYWLQTSVPYFNAGIKQTSSNILSDHITDDQKISIQTSKGKAYVKGFEVNASDKRNIITSKARDFEQKNNIQIFSPAGSYILVNTLRGVVNTTEMTRVNLIDAGSVVQGTAFATSIEYVSGTIGTDSAIYRVYLINIDLKYGKSLQHSIVSLSNISGDVLTANFIQEVSLISGTVTSVSATQTLVGKGTLFTQEVKVDDRIGFGSVTKIVLSIESDISLTLTTTSGVTITNSPLYLNYININNTGNYISKLPDSFMRNMRDSNGLSDTVYSIMKYSTFSTGGGQTTYVYSISTTGETFDGIEGHILTITSTNLLINATYSLDVSATILTISGLSANSNYRISAKVKRVGEIRNKTKSLTTKTIIATATEITTDAGTSITSGWNLTSPSISLTECDVQRIIKVTMSGSTGAYNPTGESDVSLWFNLSQNNHLTHYGISSLDRKSGIQIPSKALKITFEYFDHSAGDFFSVDSYASIPYNRIPSESHEGVIYELRDCLDFRSRIADDGLSFSGAGGSVSTPIYSSSTITTSYSYYLPRIDILSLTPSGEFNYIKGVSSLKPVAPYIGDDSINIAQFDLDAYTLYPYSIKVSTTPHRRYTMADVGKLDSRLSNVEEYVALNLLEKKTSDLQIFDKNGLTRYKNGFIADPFNTLDVSDLDSPEFKCSIDLVNRVLRPAFKEEMISLVESSATTLSSRFANGYQVTGDWITLPYTEESLVEQLVPTRSENINPFAIFSWDGFARLTPESDYWIDLDVKTNYQTTIGKTTNNTVYEVIWI